MRREDYRATLILMLGLAAATLTGFLREATLAHQLGAGRATDVYLIAFTVPEFLFVALPIVVSPAFIPLFADLRKRPHVESRSRSGVGEEGAWRFGMQVTGFLLALLLGLTALIAAGAPLYLRWLAPGFAPLERAQARQATYLMLPAISLMAGATLAGAVLQVYRRFARPALATATYNLTFVAALLGLPLAWSVARAAWGVTLGAAAALLIQLPLLWRHRPSSPAPTARRRGVESRSRSGAVSAPSVSAPTVPAPISVKDVARLAGPLAMAYAVHHTIWFVDRAMATTLQAGSVATLNYAYRLALVVGQLSGLAVSTALFPRMAEQAAGDDLTGLRTSLAGALRFVWMVGLPASCGLVVLRTPLVQVLFEHGAFDHTATAAVSDVLVWYAVAVLADALCQPLWRVLYARRRAWTVLAVNGLQTGVRVLCNVALIHNFGYNGLALSAALGLSIQALVLGQLVRRQLGTYLTASWWQSVIRVVLVTALAVIVTGLVAGQLSTLPPLAALLVSSLLGGLTYLVLSVSWKRVNGKDKK